MRFKIDDTLPLESAEILVQAGYDALTVNDQAMGGGPDSKLAEVCKSERGALVTLDLDFANIWQYPPAKYSGLLVLRPVLQTKSHVLTRLRSAAGRLLSEHLPGTLWIVDEAGIRIRTG
jgi:predicted nuclease of predicted toxin-antitoxin system